MNIDSLTGKRLGAWTLGRKLGCGAFATVFEVTGTEYVAKVIQLPTAAPSNKKLFKEQTDISNSLYKEYILYNGGNTLSQFSLCPRRPSQGSYGNDKGYRYLLMEKLDLDLGQYAKLNPSLSDVAEIGFQLIKGFKELHQLG